MNIDFRYRSIKIDKEKKVLTSINIDDFPIEIDPEIDDDFLSIVIDNYQFLSIVIITDKLYLSVTLISIDFPYQSILVGELNDRLISMILIFIE